MLRDKDKLEKRFDDLVNLLEDLYIDYEEYTNSLLDQNAILREKLEHYRMWNQV